MNDELPEMPEEHEMELKRVYPTGATEWWCNQCNYWFVRDNHGHKVIFQEGDFYAIHSGSMMKGFQIDPGKVDQSSLPTGFDESVTPIPPAPRLSLDEEDETRLDDIDRHLKDLGFDFDPRE